MTEILASYIVSAILVASAFAVALLVGLALGTKSRRVRLLFNLAGFALIVVAALEKVGWTIRPWSSGSPAEALNDLSFRIFFLIGFALLVVSWTMAFLRLGARKATQRGGRPLSMESHVPELELGLPPVARGSERTKV